MDLHFDRWLICPCGCGKHASIKTNSEEGVPDEIIQGIWQEIVQREGLEKAIDDTFHC